MQFRAIDCYTETNIVLPEETDSRKGFVNWGANNEYPQYLNTLYNNVPTLKSIIDGTVDFICGDGIEIDDILFSERVNTNGDTLDDLVRDIARDYLIYGGYAINVIRNRAGKVAQMHYIPFERIRLSEDKKTVFYSKNWSRDWRNEHRSSVGRVKFVQYPIFDKANPEDNSIYIYSNNHTDVYPSPRWSAAVKSADIERQINDFHLNSIANGFSASYMISMNNGIPDEQQADEIEDNIIEKFSGAGNGGRIVLNFANDKEHSAELSKIETDDAGEKYKTLADRSKSEIFTSFRATPNLFALPTATGFSNEEYETSFKLYNRTMVRPIQRAIAKSINNITGDDITIIPFSLD